jgi:hypothetical protein
MLARGPIAEGLVTPPIERERVPSWPHGNPDSELQVADGMSPALRPGSERRPLAEVPRLIVVVTDAARNRLAGAMVAWRCNDARGSDSPSLEPRPILVTNESGEVIIENVDQSKVVLQVSRPGYLTYRGVHEVIGGHAVHVTLDARLGIRGRVLSHDDEPVPDTIVILEPMRTSGTWFPSASRISATCDAGGYFLCTGIVDGDYQFLAAAPGYMLCAHGPHVVQARDEPVGAYLDRLMGVRFGFRDQYGSEMILPTSSIMRIEAAAPLRWAPCQVLPSAHSLTSLGLEMARAGELLVGRVLNGGKCAEAREADASVQWDMPWGRLAGTLKIRPVLEAIDHRQVLILDLPDNWRHLKVRAVPIMDDRWKRVPEFRAQIGLVVDGPRPVSFTCVPGIATGLALPEGTSSIALGIDRFSDAKIVDLSSAGRDREGSVVLPYHIERACVVRVTDDMGHDLSSYVLRVLRGTTDATSAVHLSGIMMNQSDGPLVLWNYPAGQYEVVCTNSGSVGSQQFEVRDGEIAYVSVRL